MTAQGRSASDAALTPVAALTLGLRVLMEVGVVGGLAWWGYATGTTPGSRIVLAIGAPVVGFGIWGAVDFHRLGRAGEPLRLVEELVISGLAAAGLIVSGQAVLGIVLATVSLVYHVLVYAQGSRLLKPRPIPAQRQP